MYNIGIDIHLKKVCIKGKGPGVLKQISFYNDTKGISDFIQMAKAKYWPAKAVCKSTGNYWIMLYDMLTGAGVKAKLANPKNIKVIAQAKLKDDKVDSEVLADLFQYGV